MPKELNSILATDCGSTTTKAILIEKVNNGYRLTCRGEAPTTVEAPVEDVTKGVINSINEIEELTGRKMLDNENIIKPYKENIGVDAYISTSSAGGGLQMMVSGVVDKITGESAQRAAYGAGAIVMEVIASNDVRLLYEKIDLIRHIRPDMVLLAGGTDGGTINHVVDLALLIKAANPQARFGKSYKLPIIYAGNKDAREKIKEILEERFSLDIAENIRPTVEKENLGPVRQKIQQQFLEHVMSHTPGYPRLMEMVDAPIMPTPAAVGSLIQKLAEKDKINVMGIDIGGATTDVFSVFNGTYTRTVGANLGMSYSISNVFKEAGIENILRWVPFNVNIEELENNIKNKMIRPTSIPQTLDDLIIEHAVAREALRLAIEQHKNLAVDLKGVHEASLEKGLAKNLGVGSISNSLVNMMNLDLIIGSGGILSHAPKRIQSALMMIDSFQPEGITRLAVDSIFMMPHLGVLATLNEEAAMEVFYKDCLINLGTCIAPVGKSKLGKKCLTLEIEGKKLDVNYGDITLVPLEKEANVSLYPGKSFDLGKGYGKKVEAKVTGGIAGLIIDARGRPYRPPKEENERIKQLQMENKVLKLY